MNRGIINGPRNTLKTIITLLDWTVAANHRRVADLQRSLNNHYQNTIDTDVAKGYITEVYPEPYTAAKAWFSTHHSNTNFNNPGKVRRVANASIEKQKISRNSSLRTGSDLRCNLAGVVMRFRQGLVTISVHICAMFMQLKTNSNINRFQCTRNGQHITYQCPSHILGSTDSPCVACYAVQKWAVDQKWAVKHDQMVSALSQKTYMNDLFTFLTHWTQQEMFRRT